MTLYSNIHTRTGSGKMEGKQVRITSPFKPQIPDEVTGKWQFLIDATVKLSGVPSGLIMRLNPETIEVLVNSDTEGNPYKKGEEAPLVYGLYCETVIGRQEPLVVSDATKDPGWRDHNPAIDLNMIAYLGYPISWPDGEVFGTVCLMDEKENTFAGNSRDLVVQMKRYLETDLELLVVNAELQHKNEQLEKMGKAKSKLLSLISHDVRGNVATIELFINLLSKRYGELEQHEVLMMLEELGQSAGSIHQTLEGLLLWSRSEMLDLQPKPEPVDIAALLEEVLGYFKQMVAVRRIQVRKNLGAGPATVESDRNMLLACFRNILANAIKYNRDGGEIEVSIVPADGSFRVRIADSGIGMSEADCQRLFDVAGAEAVQGGADGGGSGIGLMLTKEFLDKLGLDVAVESELDRGTAVTLTF